MHVNTDPAVAPEELVARLRPALTTGDLQDVLVWVQQKCTPAGLTSLLQHPEADTRKVAALAMGMVGDRTSVRPLAIALHDPDMMVARMAEHALWAIWFRIGKPRAVCIIKCGNTHLNHGNYESAIAKFTQATQEDPDFAEAYNQRAIAYYLSEQYAKSIEDCKQTLARMPQHFGAMAGMGHCYAHQGEWKQARHCYRLALAIHPHLDGVVTSLEQIDQLLKDHPNVIA